MPDRTPLPALDHPIWAALTTGHRSIARSNGLARGYPPGMARLVALQVPTPESFSDLRSLVAPGEIAALFTCAPVPLGADWALVHTRLIEQMVCDAPPRSLPEHEWLTLGEQDVPEMLALTAATKPGPFFPRTFELGRYVGIRSGDGRLIAMAGERLRLAEATEISAVCTDPEFAGRGYARSLVVALMAKVFAEHKRPFLHVKSENGAKALYEKLGFSVRRDIQLTLISRR